MATLSVDYRVFDWSPNKKELKIDTSKTKDTGMYVRLEQFWGDELWIYLTYEQAEQMAEKVMQEVMNYKLQQAMSESDEEPETEIQLEKEVL